MITLFYLLGHQQSTLTAPSPFAWLNLEDLILSFSIERRITVLTRMLMLLVVVTESDHHKLGIGHPEARLQYAIHLPNWSIADARLIWTQNNYLRWNDLHACLRWHWVIKYFVRYQSSQMESRNGGGTL